MRWFSVIVLAQVAAWAFAEPELPLVEQFKNEVRGIMQVTSIPAPAAIALAGRPRYRHDAATQDFAARSLKDFLQNPGTASLAATKGSSSRGVAPGSEPEVAPRVAASDPGERLRR